MKEAQFTVFMLMFSALKLNLTALGKLRLYSELWHLLAQKGGMRKLIKQLSAKIFFKLNCWIFSYDLVSLDMCSTLINC